MKTSDKLLLIWIILGLLVLTSIPVTLLVEYRSGHILNAGQIKQERFTKYELPTSMPLFISVKGFQTVNIFPADSFYFELEKRFLLKSGYQFLNDSLYLDGNMIAEGRSGVEYGTLAQRSQALPTSETKKEYRIGLGQGSPLSQQELNLYCPSNTHILIKEGEVFFHGSIHPDQINMLLDIYNGHLELGNFYSPDVAYLNRFYHHLVIHCYASGVSLNARSVVQRLDLSMDDQSILDDNDGILDSLNIESTDKSRIILNGRNIKRVKFINP